MTENTRNADERAKDHAELIMKEVGNFIAGRTGVAYLRAYIEGILETSASLAAAAAIRAEIDK